jgi:hypothetical protein
MSPQELVGDAVPVMSYRVATARDEVFVAVFEDGGLISYRHPDGTFLHTVSNEEGFRRKLEALGIVPTA